jgi:hypothetical protein
MANRGTSNKIASCYTTSNCDLNSPLSQLVAKQNDIFVANPYIYDEIKKKEGNHFVMLKGTETIAESCSNLLSIFYNLVKVLNVPVERAVIRLPN